jgi:hypothetical protein
MRTQSVNRLVFLTAVIVTGVSCGDVVRQGRAPVYLVIDRLEASRGGPAAGEFVGTLFSDVITSVTTPAPCSAETPCPTVFPDSGRVTLRLVLKDVGSATVPTAPTSNNEVTLNRYRVTYRRADGRNTPGVDVPYPFDGAMTGSVPTEGTVAFSFELVRHVAKHEAPLVVLKESPVVIASIAELSFYGADRVGNDISVTGTILVEFGDFDD